MTLTGFLLARIAEDEARAREDGANAMVGWQWKHYPREAYEALQSMTLERSKRVLAECEAKRRIVDMHSADHECTAPGDGYAGVFAADGSMNACPTMVALGTIYADHPDYHPDYREEWKP